MVSTPWSGVNDEVSGSGRTSQEGTAAMTEKSPSPNDPALTLFPIYQTYHRMVTTELEGLTAPQLDWDSDRWGWSVWSIRRHISHVASHLFRHYLLSRNWGDVLFPMAKPHWDELYYLAAIRTQRLDENQWWEMDAILGKLGRGAGAGPGHPAPGDGGLGTGADHQSGRPLLL